MIADITSFFQTPLQFADLQPIRSVQILFCILVAFNVLRIFPKHRSFYRWFSKCGFEIAEHRGFGQTACKAFGVIPNPPALTNFQFTMTGFAFISSLVLSCTNLAPRIFLFASLVLYWLYFAQLYCEAHVGAHVIVMIPPMLFITAVAPNLTGTEGSVYSSMLPIVILKLILTTAYCSAGVSKLWASVKSGFFWGNGSTLQYYIFESLMMNRPKTSDGSGMPHWTFGIPSPFSYQFQRFLFQCPRLCAILSVKSLIFEACAPVILFFPQFGVLFALVGVSFHYGIALFQNIDFVTWWGPMYLIFLFEDSSVTGNMIEVAQKSFEESPYCTALMLTYLFLHVCAMVYAMITKAEILPFSSFHMFSEPKNLWDPSTNKNWYITDKPHDSGTLKNYCFPFCRPQVVTVEELDLLPFKYVLISNRQGKTSLVGNIHISQKMSDIISKMNELWCAGQELYLNSENAAEILTLLEAGKREFSLADRK